ncbi:MAG: DpnI domain-containing protein [Candidatus Bathyarchaeia archaeon]
MDLSLDPRCLDMYTSSLQQARCLSEGWAENNLYCPSCLQPTLSREKASTKVLDFRCPQCYQTYNIKASMKPFAERVRDAEYHTFMQAVEERTNPNLVLMHYDKPRLRVVDLEVIPRFFFVPSCIIPSKPTRPKSRGKPWQGCYISLELVPYDGRIRIIEDERIEDRQMVHDKYLSTAKLLLRKTVEGRGWTADVLRCVRALRRQAFTLEEFCQAYQEELQSLHPKNRFIRAKIRQQLQVLRDNAIMRFRGGGNYELV